MSIKKKILIFCLFVFWPLAAFAQLATEINLSFKNDKIFIGFSKLNEDYVFYQRKENIVRIKNPNLNLRPSILYAGFGTRSGKAALSYAPHSERFYLTLLHKGDTYQTRFYRGDQSVLLFKVPSVLSRSCSDSSPSLPATLGNAADNSDGSNQGEQAVTVEPSTLESEIYVDARLEQKFGNELLQVIENIVNASATFYLNDLSVNFIANITLLNNPVLPNPDLITLLESYSDFMNNEHLLQFSDVGHYITAHDDGSATAGLAYVGFVCQVPALSYSVTEYTQGITHILLAHEIGHNLGATHPSNNKGIMSAVIKGNESSFSDFSKTEILHYLLNHGQCLAADPSDQSVESLSSNINLTLSIKKKMKSASFTARVQDFAGLLTDNCQISLYGAKKLKKLKSLTGLSNARLIKTIGGGLFATSGEVIFKVIKLKKLPSKASYYTVRLQCGDVDTVLLKPRKLKGVTEFKTIKIDGFFKLLEKSLSNS